VADWLIQRLDLSGPADANGVWVDEGVVVDVAAGDEGALRAAVEGFVLNRPHDTHHAQRRVSNLTATREFTLGPSAMRADVQPKSVRTKT
jgi:hypothetical protein